MEEEDDAVKDTWHLDDAAQARHVTTIKNHPDSAEAAKAREELLRAHRPLIRRHALRYAWRDGWLRELVDAGVAGYLEAVPLFDPARGALWPYAQHNVRGAIQDEAWRLGADAMGVPADDKTRAELIQLRHLDPRHEMDDVQVAEAIGVTPQRVIELRRLAGRAARLESPIASGSKNDPESNSKTRQDRLGTRISDDSRFPGYSKMFERQDTAMWRRDAQTYEATRWIAALYSAFGENEIGGRNRRIVLSHLRRSQFAVAAAQLLGYLDEPKIRVMTDYRFPVDADSERIGGPGAALVVTVVTEGWPVDGKAQADRAHADRELKRSWMRVWLKQQTPRPRLSAAKEVWKKTQIVAATPRAGFSFDWPFPQAVPDIAKALDVTERAIYKIIARFHRALAAIRAEGDGFIENFNQLWREARAEGRPLDVPHD